MFPSYRVMRALNKTKFARDFFWAVARKLNAKSYSKFVSELSLRKSIYFQGIDADSIVRAINADGATVGPSLPSGAIKEIYDFALANPCYADRDLAYPFMFDEYANICDKLRKEVLVAQYFNILECPLIRSLSNDAFILGVAAKYLRSPPVFVGANLWWSFPAENASQQDRDKHAHVFHYDLDDIKFIKFFYYITDVGDLDGPHVYVRGSNKAIRYKNNILKSKRFSDAEIETAYGEDAVVSVLGPAGTCLIEDTITLHKGKTSRNTPRLILQFQYAIYDYGMMSDVR